MKTTKKLACSFAALAMLMMTYSPARAQYMHQALQGNTPFTLNLQGSAPIAVTIYYLREGGIADIQLLVSPRGDVTIPRRASRVVFEVDASRGSTGLFTVTQGGQLLADESLSGQLPHSIRIVGDVAW